MSQHDESEDLLLERLREATSGESSLRQLRRRYDLLRRDYDVLLDRLAELEERLTIVGTAPERYPEPPSPPPAAPPPAARSNLRQQLLAPLLELRDEYASALDSIQSIVGGLDTLSQGAMKGQRSAPQPGAPATPPQGQARSRQVEVEVQSGGFGSLLDFQERLAGLPGVARVSIHAIDSERATFAIELES